MREIFGRLNLAGSVADKSDGNLIPVDAASIVRYPDKGDAAFFDFHCHCGRFGIYRIFQQFFYDAGRPFHYFSGSDFIDCFFTQYANLRHILLRFLALCRALPAIFQFVLQPVQRVQRIQRRQSGNIDFFQFF